MDQRSAGFVCKGPEVNVFIFEGHSVITIQLCVGKAAETCTDEWTWLPAGNIIYKMGGCLDLAVGHDFADPGIKGKSSSNRVLLHVSGIRWEGQFESHRPYHSS